MATVKVSLHPESRISYAYHFGVRLLLIPETIKFRWFWAILHKKKHINVGKRTPASWALKSVWKSVSKTLFWSPDCKMRKWTDLWRSWSILTRSNNPSKPHRFVVRRALVNNRRKTAASTLWSPPPLCWEFAPFSFRVWTKTLWSLVRN